MNVIVDPAVIQIINKARLFKASAAATVKKNREKGPSLQEVATHVAAQTGRHRATCGSTEQP